MALSIVPPFRHFKPKPAHTTRCKQLESSVFRSSSSYKLVRGWRDYEITDRALRSSKYLTDPRRLYSGKLAGSLTKFVHAIRYRCITRSLPGRLDADAFDV
jgi:hypothetical protein